MYYALAPGARLYRITETGVAWPTPVLGQGAFFNSGGRYNYPRHETVYCAEDPLAAICGASILPSRLRLATEDIQAQVESHYLPPGIHPLFVVLFH